MLRVGSVEHIREEARRLAGPRMFECPTCGVPPREHCVRKGGGNPIQHGHGARWRRWREYQNEAPARLAWLETMLLPILEGCVEDYLVGRKRPKRRKVDIELALKRIEERRALWEGEA